MGNGKAGGEELAFKLGDFTLADQFMIHGGNGILPEERLFRNLGSTVTHDGTHVAMREFEPRFCEGVGELIGVLVKALRDLVVNRIFTQRDVGGEHHRCVAPGWIMGVWHSCFSSTVLWGPLPGSGGAFAEFPIITEEVVEVTIGPSARRVRPGSFETAGDGVLRVAFAEGILPAETLLFERCCLGFRADVALWICRSVCFTKGVPTCDEGHGFLVVHGHAREGLADVTSRGERVGFAIGALGIHVDQAHLNCAQRLLQMPVTRVAFVAEPFAFGTPIDVLLCFPDIFTSATEAVGSEAHGLESDVACEDHEVSPGDLMAILFFDRPEKATCFVEIGIVRPAVERCETQGAVACSAASVCDAVGACTVPGHANEKGAVVAVVSGPPLLGVRHQMLQVLFDGREVELGKLPGVAEILTHWISLG